jgi:hypothetical protein
MVVKTNQTRKSQRTAAYGTKNVKTWQRTAAYGTKNVKTCTLTTLTLIYVYIVLISNMISTSEDVRVVYQ